MKNIKYDDFNTPFNRLTDIMFLQAHHSPKLQRDTAESSIPSVTSCGALWHVSPRLVNFHWLRAPERIQFKLASSFTELFTARRLVTCPTCWVVLLTSSLRSSSTSRLDVSPSCRVTVGDRLFAVASPVIWNSLPGDITSASSLSVFRRKLKIHLFRQSYQNIAP